MRSNARKDQAAYEHWRTINALIDARKQPQQSPLLHVLITSRSRVNPEKDPATRDAIKAYDSQF